MINVSNLKKTYNKGKENQIKVINDTSLSLPSTGLISFLGQSGSGKTTLLNTIGFLDKADSGTISYDENTFSSYKMSKVDKYRAANIGYIFQNYNLIQDVTVEENLRIALDLIDVTDEEEISKRIEYVLKAVGLYKYRKKLALALSGGQQQRVSIARALIKNSKVIIADEPTGNLDSTNSIEIMNILKKVSEKSLVLLVTHDKTLAEVYSNQIIEVSDGNIIKTYTPDGTIGLANKNDDIIHLLDYTKLEEQGNTTNTTIYHDGSYDDLKITIVVKNGTYYLESNHKIKLLEDTNLTLKNDHYEEIKEAKVDDFDYDTSWYSQSKKKNIFKSIGLEFIKTFKGFFQTRKRAKFFHIAFVLIGILLAGANTLFIYNNTIDTSNFSNETDAYQLSLYESENKNLLLEANENGLINSVYYRDDGRYIYISKTINSFITRSYSKNVNFYSLDLIEDYDMICGDKSSYVLGKDLADDIIATLDCDLEYEDLVGIEINMKTISGISSKQTNCGYYSSYSRTFISNISDETSDYSLYKYSEYKVVYGRDVDPTKNEMLIKAPTDITNLDEKFDSDLLIYPNLVGYFTSTNDSKPCTYYLVSSLEDIEFKPELCVTEDKFDYEIVEGNTPNNDNEILVHADTTYEIGEEKDGYKIVGKFIYTSNYPSYYQQYIIGTSKEMNKILISSKSYNTVFTTNNINNLKSFFKSNGLTINNAYEISYNEAKADMKEANFIIVSLTAGLVVISMIYIYFTMRSKMIQDIYDIGVYRCLGLSRGRLISKYLIDIIVTSTLTTLLGFILFSLIYGYIAGKITSLGGSLPTVLDNYITYLSVLFLYALNIFFGLLPIVSLLRKTPAEIISKYDI